MLHHSVFSFDTGTQSLAFNLLAVRLSPYPLPKCCPATQDLLHSLTLIPSIPQMPRVISVYSFILCTDRLWSRLPSLVFPSSWITLWRLFPQSDWFFTDLFLYTVGFSLTRISSWVIFQQKSSQGRPYYYYSYYHHRHQWGCGTLGVKWTRFIIFFRGSLFIIRTQAAPQRPPSAVVGGKSPSISVKTLLVAPKWPSLTTYAPTRLVVFSLRLRLWPSPR